MTDYIDKVNFYNEGGGLQKSVPIQDSDTKQATEKNASDISSLQTIVSKNSRDISSLKTYRLYTGGKVAFVGDSFLAQENGFADRVIDLLELADDYIKIPNSGGGYITPGASGFAFGDLISRQRTDDTISLVIIEGGINDGTPTTVQMANAVKDAINSAKTVWPNAKILLCYNATIAFYPRAQIAGIEFAAQTERVNFIDPYIKYLGPSAWNSDNIHPNAAGALEMGNVIANYIINHSQAFPALSGEIQGDGVRVLYSLDDSVVTFRILGTPNSQNICSLPIFLKPYSGAPTRAVYVDKIGAANVGITGNQMTTTFTGKYMDVYLSFSTLEFK